MISLHGKTKNLRIGNNLENLVWRLDKAEPTTGFEFNLVSTSTKAKEVFGLIKSLESPPNNSFKYIQTPEELDYLKYGDIISLSYNGKNIRVQWRGNTSTNSLLLTERCDNYCLMCSQPPRKEKDDWLLKIATDVISLMPTDANVLGFTGGEPTIYGDDFIDLIGHFSTNLPNTALHILSNGRRFADAQFTSKYANATNKSMMIGIPIYGPESQLHDYVVQAEGAFDETINGILNLGEYGQSIEIRVVAHKQTASSLVGIAEYISRNLPFVDQVAIMGLEMIGLARGNFQEVWIDPVDYKQQLAEAVNHLSNNNIHVMVYNHQLCLTHKDTWKFNVQSISDWKNEYDPVCEPCQVREKCGGFFNSAKYGASSQIQALKLDGTPLYAHGLNSGNESETRWRRRSIPHTSIN
jgi:His-Xaa-Ser system radical SAM maturase HxsC